jgi:hypothetical protein
MMEDANKGLQVAGIKESVDYIYRLARERYYGTLELRFESGSVVHIVIHQSMKPSSLTQSDKLRCDDAKERAQ